MTTTSSTPGLIRNAVEIHTEIEVPTDRQRTWDLLVDLELQPKWMKDALSIEKLTEGPVGVGTVMRVPTQILFLRTTDHMEVTAFEPLEKWSVKHVGLVTGEGTFTLQNSSTGAGTLVHWHERLSAPLGLLGRMGMTLFRPALRHQFHSDLVRFQRLCVAPS
jgi:uncharacterized membrane protein